MKDIQGALSPTSPQHQFPSTSDTKLANETKISSPKLAVAPALDVRARLNSLSNIATSRHKKIPTSSSITTLQGVATRQVFEALKRPITPTSSGDEADSSDEEAIKEEEAERAAEEEEALARKLAQLQKMMTNEKLGLVRGTTRQRGGKPRDRGRPAPLSTASGGNYRQDALSSASASTSQSISSASSPHGSILDIPSPPPERNGNATGQTPRNRSNDPSSPPRTFGRNSLRNQVHARHRPLTDPASDLSSHGSEASSFSDLSGRVDLFLRSDKFVDFVLQMPAFLYPHWKMLSCRILARILIPTCRYCKSSVPSSLTTPFGSSHFARSRLSNRQHSSIPQ